MKTTVSKVRNTLTGQVFDVVPGSLLPDFFEEVKDEEIKVGEPKVEFEIEKEEEKKPTTPKTKAKTTKSRKKTTKKGAKKDESSTK